MYTVKTNLINSTNEIIETILLPTGTVCKFMDNLKQANEELKFREMYKEIGMLEWYIENKGYDF